MYAKGRPTSTGFSIYDQNLVGRATFVTLNPKQQGSKHHDHHGYEQDDPEIEEGGFAIHAAISPNRLSFCNKITQNAFKPA
jgi:hypothetical protein